MKLDDKINLLIYPHVIFRGRRGEEEPIREEDIEGLFAPTEFRMNSRMLQEPARLLEKISEATRRYGPLMINVNYEGGNFSHINHKSLTQIPSAMALGSANDPKLTNDVAKIIGRELRAMGLSWNFAPVAELCLNPYFLSTGIRCFGDNPELVGEQTYQFITGMQSEGVAATAKHFPGAGITNYCFEDIYPLITNEFGERDLLPFKRAIEAGVTFIMPRFGVYTSIDASEISAFSEKLVKGFLRNKLDYDGIVVTDSLAMGSLSRLAKKVGIGNLAVKALKAGNDMILLETTISFGSTEPSVMRKIQENYREAYVDVHNSVKKAVLDGSLDIEESVKKVIGIESVYAIKHPVPEDKLVLGKYEDRKIVYQTAKKAVKVLYNNGVLPLDKSSKILVVRMSPEKSNRADSIREIKETLEDEIKKIGGTVDSLVVDRAEDLRDLLNYNCVIVETYFGYLKYNDLDKQKKMIDHIAKGAKNSVCIAKGIPLEIGNQNLDAIVATFDVRGPSLRAAAEALYEGKKTDAGLPLNFLKHRKITHPSFFRQKYKPNVTVIIPTVGGEWLERTIDYVYRELELLHDPTNRVVVGLNNFTQVSEKATQEAQGKYSFTLEKTNKGKLNCVKSLVREYSKKTDYFILIDDDVIPTKGSFKNMLEELTGTENCSYLIGGMPIPVLEKGEGYFWRKVFSLNRNDQAGIFYAPTMPWGQFLAMHKDSFPFLEGNLPATINDSFFYLCSFFPNVKIAENAHYYYWPSNNLREYTSRKKRIAEGINDVLNIVNVPLLNHLRYCLEMDAKKDISSLVKNPANWIYLSAYNLANMSANRSFKSNMVGWETAHSTKPLSDYDSLYESGPSVIKRRDIDLREIVRRDVAIPKKEAIYLME